MKSPGGKIMSLEGARFLAAFSVMAVHTTSEIMSVGHFPPASLEFVKKSFAGAAPVMFFFVLSGFVMYTAHQQDFGRLSRLPRYVLKRAVRIFPLYWLSLLLGQAVYDLAIWKCGFVRPPYVSLFLLSPLSWRSQTVEVNPVAWTLRYEIAFYVMFMMVFIPRIGPWLLGLWFGALIWYNYPAWPYAQWLSQITGSNPDFWPAAMISHAVTVFALLFFAGLGGGFLYANCRPGPRLALALFVLGCAGLVWELWAEGGGQNYPSPLRRFPAGLVYAFWIATVAMAERAGALPRWQGFGSLGALSYPLYLLHGVVLLGFSFLLADAGGFVHRFSAACWFTVLLAISLSISSLAVWAIDRPAQKFMRRFI